ncbi:MAG: hypothetical protein KBT20_04360 [Bacteroidales bacterium]|nr:hypothetical protein [Candidatus Liminaster caballi]
MDRFSIIIERQEQLEALIKEWGFLPFFKNVIPGFFEYLISKKGEPYGWGVARYCTPEAMYPDLFPLKDRVEGRTPKQSRKRIIDHLQGLFPDVDRSKIEKLV